MRSWSVVLAGFLAGLALLWASGAGSAAATTVPRDRVVASLVALNWRTDEASRAAATWPTSYSESGDAGVPWARNEWGRATYTWDKRGWVELDPDKPYSDAVVEHEYHHLEDYARGRTDGDVTAWWGAIAGVDARAWAEIPARHPGDQMHWNHYLAERLRYRYEALPERYRQFWFPYARVLDQRTTLPLVLRPTDIR
jgi:hypothetical protein